MFGFIVKRVNVIWGFTLQQHVTVISPLDPARWSPYSAAT